MRSPEYTTEYDLPRDAIAGELRRENTGNKQAYLRYRSTSFVVGGRSLIQGAEQTLARAASQALSQIGGHLVRFAAGACFVEFEFLLPETENLRRANTLVRRATSIAYKQQHRGIGSPSANGFLWAPRTVSQTVAPLSDRSARTGRDAV